jgi:phosphate-selective porin OprO/OprP
MNLSAKIILVLILVLSANFFLTQLFAQEVDSTKTTTNKPLVSYGEKGFELNSSDGNYLMQIQWRGQFRMAYPTDSDPINLSDFQKDQLYLRVNRARMKVGGHAYSPNLKYYLEYDLFGSNLLDFRLMIEKLPYLKLKVGQWKAQYNRERIISSGKQQTIERSIITRPFTIDRQQGVSVFGRLDGNGLADFNYWASVFMGTGRGGRENDDTNPMFMTRWQWNFMGEPLEFSGSDLKYHKKFTAIIALAGVTNRSPYTRFSTAGGGQLEGFEEGVAGQYRVNQLLVETAGKYKGFSWQQELHWKEINDKINITTSRLMGNLFQLGYFPHYKWSKFPKKMELYGRHAFYDPSLSLETDFQNEFSTGVNWFFKGHLNKLSAEYSYFRYTIESDQFQTGSRARLQWDVSF